MLLSQLSLIELQVLIAKKEIQAIDIIRDSLASITKWNELNSFITVNADDALAVAKNITHLKGRLSGIPVAIKDNICTAKIRTTCASKILENYIPPKDATVVKLLKDSGSVIIGKTNLDEFAMGTSGETSFWGNTKNPWNLACVAGGSSSGSAAAVASGIVPLALATDTGGSIRQPAAFSGIVGVKPTYGRVSRYGLIAFASSLDQIGVMARSVTDAAIGLEVIAGYDKLDATSSSLNVPRFSTELLGDVKGLRVAYVREFMDKAQNQNFKDCLEKLKALGCNVIEVSLPHAEAILTYQVIAAVEASSNLSRYDGVRFGRRVIGATNYQEEFQETRGDGFGQEVKRRILLGTYLLSGAVYNTAFETAQKIRRLIVEDYKKAFQYCDLIVTPTTPSGAFKIGAKQSSYEMSLQDYYTVSVNLAGLPAMSVPCGFDENNMPLGLQFIGSWWQESTMLKVAANFEKEIKWRYPYFE